MNKLRLSDALEEVTAISGGICSSDPRIIQLINEAQRRLCRRGKWVGTVQRYKIAATSGLVTWPRQVLTPESIAFCNCPGVIRNGWYEFLGHGPGLLESEDGAGWYDAIDRGTSCLIADITAGATDRKVRAYSDHASDNGKIITVQGYDENANWIRTLVGMDWIDGEQISLATTGTLSTKKFTSVTAVIKPVTNLAVRLYEYNTTTAANVRQIGFYEPDETNPIYRRTLLPGIMDTATCCNVETRNVTVAVKLKFIPAVNNDDWLMLGNLDAIKLGMQAILKERKNRKDEAIEYWDGAIKELEHELREYQGDGVIAQPRFDSVDVWGGGIETLI